MSNAEASGSGEIETRTAAEQVDDLDTLVTISGEALDTEGACWSICSLLPTLDSRKLLASATAAIGILPCLFPYANAQ